MPSLPGDLKGGLDRPDQSREDVFEAGAPTQVVVKPPPGGASAPIPALGTLVERLQRRVAALSFSRYLVVESFPIALSRCVKFDRFDRVVV